MLLEALPIEVKESALTDSQKKVLNVFYTYNTLDRTNENGSFFIANNKLREEAGIGSNKTIQSVLSFLINNDFIERKAGSRTNKDSVASTYIVKSENIIEWCANHKNTKKIKGTPMGTPSNKCTNTEKDTTLKTNELENKGIGTPMGTPNEKCTNEKCTNVPTSELAAILAENKAIKQEISELKELVKLLIASNNNTEIKGTPMGTPNEKCTNEKCTNTEKDTTLKISELETKGIGTPMGTLEMGTPNKCTTDIDIESDLYNKKTSNRSENTDSKLEVRKKSVNTTLSESEIKESFSTSSRNEGTSSCESESNVNSDLKESSYNSNEFETEVTSQGEENERPYENTSNESEVKEEIPSDTQGESNANENSKDMRMTQEERAALNEYYSKEWREIEETRSEKKEIYSKLTKAIETFNEFYGYFYNAADVDTFNERERQLRGLIYQMVNIAQQVTLTDKQIDYIISLEDKLNKTCAGKEKFRQAVEKTKAEKEKAQAQAVASGYTSQGSSERVSTKAEEKQTQQTPDVTTLEGCLAMFD